MSGTAGREGGRMEGRLCVQTGQCWDPFASLQLVHVCNYCGAGMSVTPNACWMGFAGDPGLQKHADQWIPRSTIRTLHQDSFW